MLLVTIWLLEIGSCDFSFRDFSFGRGDFSFGLSRRGLENQCSIYNLENKLGDVERTDDKVARISLPNKIVAQHTKYISNCAFCGSDQQLLTSSADSTCALWDLEQKDPIRRFTGHKTEILG